MMYDFVFTFEIVDCTEEEKANEFKNRQWK